MFKFFIKHFIVTKLKIPKFIKLTIVEENTSLLDTYTQGSTLPSVLLVRTQ